MTTERDRRNQLDYRERMGMEKGKAERTLEIAKSLLADGMSAEKVSQYTGLTESEIEELYR